MKNKFSFRIIVFLIPIILFSSCNWPEENPNLVNPSLKSPTIGIRYLNLSGGESNKTLLMNSDAKLDNIPFATISIRKNPPADSIYLSVLKDEMTEYAQKKPLKFLTRNVNYTIISLASKNGSKNYRDTDTLVWLATSLINPENSNDAMLRLFNGVNDSSFAFSVRYGCPNGKQILSQINYGVIQSKFANVNSGDIPISIVKHKDNKTEVVGVYKINLKAKGQYCIMILPVDGQEKVYIYDELSTENEPMKPAEMLIDKYAKIRVLNFSKEAYTTKTGQDETIVANQSSGTISNFEDIKACESQSNDQLILDNSSTSDTITASFEVLAKYNLLIADSDKKVGAIKMLLPSISVQNRKATEATIRVVHTAWKREGLTLSMGLRNVEGGFKTGERLAVDLQYAQVSEPINVPAGYAPLTCFTSTEPARLASSSFTWFESGKSYLIVLGSTKEGWDIIYCIEDSDVNKNLEFLPPGAFTQLAVTSAGVESVKINISVDGKKYLQDALVPASGIIATVLPEGNAKVDASGVEHSISVNPYNRLLCVVSGNRDKLDIFDVNTPPMYPEYNFYRRRFLNAASSVPEIAIKEANSKSEDYDGVSSYGVCSNQSLVYMETRKSFKFFAPPGSSKEIYKSGDLSFSFYKSYTIIFAGSAPTGYSVIIVQEF